LGERYNAIIRLRTSIVAELKQNLLISENQPVRDININICKIDSIQNPIETICQFH